MISYDFHGRTAIVTGGTRGIGAAISAALLKAGAEVTALYGANREAAEAFAASLGADGERLRVCCCDVSDYAQAEAFFAEFDQQHERLDILVNSAGIRQDGIVPMLPQEAWQKVIDVNLTGTYVMSKLAVQRMLRHRYGRIVGITSPSGRIGFEGQANYAASKAGQVAFIKSLSKEVAKRKITANCVSPGFVDTDFIAALPPEQLAAYKAMVPLKRFGRAEEIANAVLFLASEESEYITGTVLEVSGGL
jgi:3-oxoacyl-[acyl-carrier protein] reductase